MADDRKPQEQLPISPGETFPFEQRQYSVPSDWSNVKFTTEDTAANETIHSLMNEIAKAKLSQKKFQWTPNQVRPFIRDIKAKYLPGPAADWRKGNFKVKIGPGLRPENVKLALEALADYFRAIGGIGFEFDPPSKSEVDV